MRNHQPVTQQEYQFSDQLNLVSVTDRKGHITYCNPAFIKVSGYSADELLGQPHNIVRHPDMPQEAFRDLWETTASGKLWSALVKNRRKNGDHYWVKAHVTPISDSAGRILGFMSVRTLPSRTEVAQAEQLYAGMRAEAAGGQLSTRLQQGQVRHTRLREWLQHLKQPNTLIRFTVADLGLLALVALTAKLLPWPALLLAIPLAAWLMHRQNVALILSPLRLMQIEITRMASGDLSGKVTTGRPGMIGQLQQALAQLYVNTRTVIQDVRQESLNLHVSIEEIVAGNHDLARRTTSAASSLEETAASMAQLSGTVQHSTGIAQNGATQSRQTASLAGRSHSAVHAVAATMREITESSRRISEITLVIEGVAFQTNILALNAAVEAARAGESGRGFAVVASEVRALAQRTAEAAREIKQLIAESSDQVRTGSARTSEAQDRMQEALTAVNSVATVLDEISHASHEQRQGILQISEVIVHLDQVTQQNAGMVEELSATADALRVQSNAVNHSMRMFRLQATDVSLTQAD